MRQFLEPYVHLPNTSVVTAARKDVVPDFIKAPFEPDGAIENGLWLPLPDLIKIHTKDLLENMVVVDDSMLSEIEKGITIKGGGGYDASGRHCAFR